MTKVKIEQLRAGMIVAADIKNMDDMLLVPAGCELSEKYTERYINIFRTWGITEILVEANGAETEAAPAAIEVSPEMLEEMKSHFWKLDETSPVHVEILNLITRRRARYAPAGPDPFFMPSINQLIQDIPSLASYDAVLRELEEVLNDPESTLADVCIIIETDPVLTAKLLKLGNSCFFGFSKRVETVFETISLIGIQQVRDLVAASAVMRMFDRVSADHLNPEAFWRHSLACGVASRNLAIALRCPKPEKYFVAGLLHDIGRLVLVFQAPDTAEEIFRHYHQSRMLLRDAERELLGFNHADIGAALLKVWNYPGNLIQAVSYHHNPMLAGEFPREACLVHVADHLVNAMQLGSAGERLIPPLDLGAWNRLGMTTELLEPVMKSIDEQLVAVEQAFLTAKNTHPDSPKEKLHGKVHLS